jgi:hypothetical protein
MHNHSTFINGYKDKFYDLKSIINTIMNQFDNKTSELYIIIIKWYESDKDNKKDITREDGINISNDIEKSYEVVFRIVHNKFLIDVNNNQSRY